MKQKNYLKPAKIEYLSLFCISLLISAGHSLAGEIIFSEDFDEIAYQGRLTGESVLDATDVYDGEKSAHLKGESADGGSYEVDLSDLEPGTTYRFSAMIKSSGGDGRIGFRNQDGWEEFSYAVDSVVYTNHEIIFRASTDSDDKTIFVSNPQGGGASCYVDDVVVEEVDYELIFSDEFNVEGSVDWNIWNPEIGFIRNNEEQYYQAENLIQSNGNLVISAKREVVTNQWYPNEWGHPQYADWSSGSMRTVDSFQFRFGRVVCRAKVSNLDGTWPAIWTLGEGSWPASGEIDIMENYGGKIHANFAVCAANKNPWNPGWDSVKYGIWKFDDHWVDDFHIWELEWTPHYAAIYVDGQLLNSFDPRIKNGPNSAVDPNVAPFITKPQYLLLNLAIGGSNGGNSSGLPDETPYLVDYIRVYQMPLENQEMSLDVLGGTNLNLSWPSESGRLYTLYKSYDLESWDAVEEGIWGANDQREYILNNAVEDAPAVFYRIEQNNGGLVDSQSL